MTLGPSRLADGDAPLVLDASSGLNLLGTGRAAAILRVFRRKFLITAQAAGEVDRDPLTNGSGQAALERLFGAGLLYPAQLSMPGYEHYLALVSAPSPGGLDDGEASTVAHAAEIGGIPVLDERKGTRLASPLCAQAPACTLDILSHTLVLNQLGESDVAEAVHSALLHARMRVPAFFRPWVMQLLGPDRLLSCSSIPRRWLTAQAAPIPGKPAE